MTVGASLRSANNATVGWVFDSSMAVSVSTKPSRMLWSSYISAGTSWLPMAGPPARTWILTPVSWPWAMSSAV